MISSPECVGRERELAALAEALAAPPAVMLAQGEAGIGKSRLVQEFLGSPAGSAYRALVAVCPPFREPYTLAAVVDAVRQATPEVSDLQLTGLAGTLRPLFPEWADDLPPAPEPVEDAKAARYRLFRAFVELFDRLGVTVLVVEDVHWADEATLDFLLFLVSHRPQPVSLMVTYRPEEVPESSSLLRLSSRLQPGVTRRRLVLGPLNVAQTGALVSSMLADGRVSEQFAAFLHARTDGVPLAIEESVRLMHERADLTRRSGGWARRRLDRIEVPPTIRDAVLERVGRLRPDTRTILQAAAVLGDQAGHQVLSAVAGLAGDQTGDPVAEGLSGGLLREDGRGLVSFRHTLACQAVYETIPQQQRRIMHLRAGRALEELPAPPVAQLARHFREGGEVEAWRRYAERAADLSIQSGDTASAALLLHNLVTSSALPAQRLALLVGKIPFQSLSGPDPFSSLVDMLRSALRPGLLTPEQEAEIRFQLGRVFMVAGAMQAGRLEMERAVADLPPDSLEAARARNFLGIPIGNVRPAAEHLRWLRDAPFLPPSIPAHERLRLRGDRILALLLLGEEAGWEEVRGFPDHADGPLETAHVALAKMNIAEAAMLWGRYDEARRSLAKARDLVDRDQLSSYLGTIAATESHLDWFTGAWHGLLDRAASLADDQDGVRLKDRCEAALVVGLMQAATGDAQRAEEQLLFAGSDDQQRVESAAALARLWLRDGRVDDALRVTEEPIDIPIRTGIWPRGAEVVPVRVAALVAAGCVKEAVDLAAAFEQVMGGRQVPPVQASLALCQAILAEAGGQHSEAATLYARAAATWRALPRPYSALLAQERQATCLLAAGQRAAGTRLLSSVLPALSALGARQDAERVSSALREHGREPNQARRPGRPSYGNHLSPRELEVARLLVGGRTNRQIADALVVSTQTVASHVQSAMRKLRVVSRTALALKVVDLGLVARDERSPAGDQ